MRFSMNEYINIIKSDKTILFGFLLSLSLVCGVSVYSILYYSQLPPFIPLYNQMPWGEERLGAREHIGIPIIIALIALFLNSLLSLLLYKKIPLVSRVLSVTSLLICFLTLLLVVRTIHIIV